jgi:hypothetical protein
MSFAKQPGFGSSVTVFFQLYGSPSFEQANQGMFQDKEHIKNV